MKKKVLSLLALLLAALMFLAACGTETPPVTDDTGSGAGTDVGTEPGETKKTEPELSGKTYNGANFAVFVSGYGIGKMNDISDENKNGYQKVASAQFKRNAKVQALYDITITNEEKFGASGGNGPGYQRVTQDFAAGDATFDLCYVGTRDAAQLAVGGYLYDMKKLPYVDLSCDWWDQDCNRDLMIYGKMFYTTGEISTADNLATHCILFNKKVAKEKNINDLYTLASEGKWTLDTFLQDVKLYTNDVNGDQKMDDKDAYGLLTWNDVMQACLTGSEIRIATVDEDGEITLTLYSEKSVDIMNRLCDIVNDGQYVYNYTTRNMIGTQPSTTYDAERDSMFNENRCLFYGTILNSVPRYRDSETLDFGILPYPKYDESQEKYGSYVGAAYSSMVCVENMIEDPEYIGTVIESMAYESARTVKPAYYDQTLKGRYIKDDESADMLDIIFNQRCFDLGMYYNIPTGNALVEQITSIIAKREAGTFASRYEATKEAAFQQIEQLNDSWYRFSD